LDGLTAACLITEDGPGRYGCHDLLTAYAVELTASQDPPAAVRAATLRMLEHYLHTADHAFAGVYPGWTQLDLSPPVSGVVPEEFAGRDDALAWYDVEHKALIAVVTRAAEDGFDAYVGQLAWTLAAYLERHGHWQEWATVGQAALAAGQRSGDLIAQAHAHRWLGDMCARRGRHQDAHAHLRQSLALYEELGDGPRQASAHLTLGVLLGQQAQYAEALAHEQQALRLSRAAGDLVGQARALNAVGWFHAMLADYEQAGAYCEEALTLSPDPHLQAAARDSLGYVHHQRGDYEQAISHYLEALRIRRSTGDYHPQAEILAHLGEAYHALGRTAEARDSWRQALTILEDLGDPDADDVRARLERLA
jgi:tetratricopeptide (TPR) repeat protein